MAICCTEELTLMNLPRWRLAAHEVMSAMAGTMRPENPNIMRVVAVRATVSETGGRLVTHKMGTMEKAASQRKTRRLPNRSESRPTNVMMDNAASPPHK